MWSLVPVLLSLCSPGLSLRMREPPPPLPLSRVSPQELWFDARLDHFDASNTDVFPMRFYYNNEFNSSSYLLVYVGGEWSISPGWLQAGLMFELAEELGAAMVYSEHRYYGQTRPTANTSSASLRYLTADQALGDLTQLLHHLASDQFEGGRFRSARVALVGCSYAGSLATWARLAMPHRVVAAFSDSGPLLAQEDFPEYLEVITEALAGQGGAGCVQSIRDGMEALMRLVTTTDGLARVSDMFRTCAPLTASPLDLATFSWLGITETFAYLVQYALPGDIAAACDRIQDPGVADPLQRLANWVTSQPWAQPCIESRYSQFLADHTNTSYDASDSVMRLWTYQTCVEYGWYQTTSSPDQPFLTAVPLDYFHQMCRDFFGDDFDESLLRSGIARTNIMFGARALPDRVVSVAGGADPWAPMGPSAADATPLAPVYVVPDASHCRAVGRADSSDPALHEAQSAVKRFLREQLEGRALPSAAAPPRPLTGVAALAAAVVLAARR